MPSTGLFKVAHISAAHGIRGEVKLACFLENSDDLMRYNPLLTKQGKPYNVTITGHLKDHVMVKIEGIADRNAAEMLRGIELFGEVAKRPPAAEGEIYLQDLVGLSAVLADGTAVGKVTAMHNFGAGDIIEIKTADDELLLPFREPFVGTITHQQITITLPTYMGDE